GPVVCRGAFLRKLLLDHPAGMLDGARGVGRLLVLKKEFLEFGPGLLLDPGGAGTGREAMLVDDGPDGSVDEVIDDGAGEQVDVLLPGLDEVIDPHPG